MTRTDSPTMEESVLTQQLQYLDKASELLLVSSPAVAAHLHVEIPSRAEAANADAPSTTTRSELCPACGHFLISKARSISSSSNKGKTKPVTHRSRKDRLAGRTYPLGTTLECSKCQSAIPAPIRRPKPRRVTVLADAQAMNVRKMKQGSNESPAGLTLHKPPGSPTAPADTAISKPQTATVKKRSRDKKSSLRALLADRNRTEAARPKGFGLSLSDFTMS